jgi:hypothetical protein
MKTKLALFALALTLPAFAATITFNAVPSSGNPVLTTLTTEGYTFASAEFRPIDIRVSAFGMPMSDGIYLSQQNASIPNSAITMTRASGEAFSLAGLSMAKPWWVTNAAAAAGMPNADYVEIVGALSGGGVVSVTAPLQHNFLPVSLQGIQSVTSVQFIGRLNAGGLGGVAIDNLIVTPSVALQAASLGIAVPDTGWSITMALMGCVAVALFGRMIPLRT